MHLLDVEEFECSRTALNGWKLKTRGDLGAATGDLMLLSFYTSCLKAG